MHWFWTKYTVIANNNKFYGTSSNCYVWCHLLGKNQTCSEAHGGNLDLAVSK